MGCMDQNGSIRVLLKKKDVQQQTTQHTQKQKENGLKNHMVHSSFVVGVWMELNNSMNFA